MLNLPPVDKALGETRKALEAGATLVSVFGPQGAGKSTVLTRLVQQWPLKGPPPILVRIANDDDAGLCGLGGLASQLFAYDAALDGAIRNLSLSFADKLDKVVEVLGARQVPVLVDAPVPQSGDEVLQTAFSLQNRDLVQGILDAGTTVVCASSTPLNRKGVEQVQVVSASHVESVLAPAHWNGLGAVAGQLMAHAGELETYSPLELRLAVLLASQPGFGVQRVLRSGWRLDELLDELFRRLPTSEALKKLLARLALVRAPISEGRFRELTKGADSKTKKTLEQVLLYQEDGCWLVHEAIAAEARQKSWLSRDEARQAHRQLAEQSRVLFKAATGEKDLAGALRWELETIHHRTEAGDATLLKDLLVFVEQYDNCGRRLGLDGVALLKRGQAKEGRALLKLAVSAYRRALTYNEHDWYARHYLAFNLDALGEDPGDVEQEYRRAIDERPVFVWSHSRYLRFLVTTGQLKAFRAAWVEARRHLLPFGQADNPKVYEELHCDVAMTLLYFAQPALARLVLDDVPEGARSMLRRYRLLAQLALSQEEALRDELVFPPSVPVGDRWNGPHLLPNDQRPKVKRWWPGRVAFAGAEGVRLRSARQTKGGPQYGWKKLSAQTLANLKAADLREGTFVEVVEEEGGPRLLRHPPTGDYFEDVTPRFPAPDRFAP